MLRVVNCIVLWALLLVITSPLIVSVSAEEPVANNLIFSELKVRNDVSGYNEFFELHNPNPYPVDLSQYEVAYFNHIDPIPGVSPNSVKPLVTGAADIMPYAHLVFGKDTDGVMLPPPFTSLLDATGTLRLIYVSDDGRQVVDEVAWTNKLIESSMHERPFVLTTCSDQSQNCSDTTLSFTRYSASGGLYADFPGMWSALPPSPWQSVVLILDSETDETVEEEDDDDLGGEAPVVPDVPRCADIVISELLPNPAGTDTGSEYIELYNPTNEVITMSGCSLQTSANSRVYDFGGVELRPGQYTTIWSSLSGLTLANASGGTVWLLTNTEEVYTVVYPGGLEDDQSWADINGVWQPTFMPTPGLANVDIAVRPCADGYERNVITNRCQKTEAAVTLALTPCKPGQERNPLTNRCRSAVVLAKALTPCKPGQTRNPETNRCRADASDNILAACAEGQERNPETNRCRKIAQPGNTLAAVHDVQSSQSVSKPSFWVFLGVLLLVVGYALYEWRVDLRNWLHNTFRR